MDIVKHIRELLYLHDCVIVPGFGGFVANYKPAEIDFSRNVFSPPTKSIGFNRALMNSDGLLISHISNRTGLGYVDVKRNLEEFVASALRRIENGKKLAFEEVGFFHLDKHRLIQFEPDPSGNFLLDTWGMSWFQASPLQEYDVRKKVFRDRPPVSGRKLSRTARRILIGVPFLVALALVPLQLNRMEKLDLNFSSFNFLGKKQVMQAAPEQQEETAARYEEAVEDIQQKEVVVFETLAESPVASEPVAPALPEIQYYIIAGSFQSPVNAGHLRDQLQKEGYATRVLDPEQGKYRVSLGEYPDKASAMAALDNIRILPGKKDCWVLKH